MTPLLTGLGLAVAAGWNAWAVLLVFHGIVRLLPQDFPGPATSFLASPFVFQLALVLFLAEFIVAKIPLADRVWESAQTLLRPIVGALLARACVAAPSWSVLAGVALAAAAVTLAEDVVAVALAVLLFFQPWLTVLVLSGVLLLLLTHWSRVRHALAVLFFRLQHPRRRTP